MSYSTTEINLKSQNEKNNYLFTFDDKHEASTYYHNTENKL